MKKGVLKNFKRSFRKFFDSFHVIIAVLYYYAHYYIFSNFSEGIPSEQIAPLLLSYASSGKARELISLLKFCQHVDVVDENGNTPLLLAAKEGKLLSVIALLNSGANIDSANRSGLTALMLSVINNHYSVFYYLLVCGSNILLCSLTNQTVIQSVIGHSRIKMLDLLVSQRQINLNGRYMEGYTPLMNAIFANQIKVVRWLLSHGARLDQFNDDGESPLFLAEKLERTEIENFLKIKINSGKQIYNKRMKTPQSLASLQLMMAKLNYQAKDFFNSSNESVNSMKKTQDHRGKISPYSKVKPKSRRLKQKAMNQHKFLPVSVMDKKLTEYATPGTSYETQKGSECSPSIAMNSLSKEIKDEPSLARIKSLKNPLEIKDALTDKAPTSSGFSVCNLVNILEPVKILEKNLPEHVTSIMLQLEKLGFQIYLVGGCIRDMLLGKEPSDFDMVCDAPAFIVFQKIRLGAFSKHLPNLYKIFLSEISIDLLCVESFNFFLDAKKRDFTCNALYMDSRHCLFDPLGNIEDILKNKVVVIGDPRLSFEQDPTRLLRLVRLVSEHEFVVSNELQKIVMEKAHLIKNYQESKLHFQMRKLFLRGYAVKNFHFLLELGLLFFILPDITHFLLQDIEFKKWIIFKLEQTDRMVYFQQPVSLHYILAMFRMAVSFVQEETVSSMQKSKLCQFFKETDYLSYQIITNCERNGSALIL